MSALDAGRLDAALPLLDAMISIDNYLNETTRHAHVIPRALALEQPHCDEAIWGFAEGGGLLVASDLRSGERPHEWEIRIRLGAHPRGMPARRRRRGHPRRRDGSPAPLATASTGPRSRAGS